MSNFKTSLLINRQVPEFVREEYPLFITFIEAYYEFLENKQGTQNNDLITRSKNLRYLPDVDKSINDFENHFFNTYANLFPKDAQVDKAFLIKNVLPLYLSKGSEKSFKLLFRMLFNDELNIILPKNNVLRASDGKWIVDNLLKIDTDVRSIYIANGNTSISATELGNTTFLLAQEVNFDEIEVYVDNVLKTNLTDYYIRKESKKLIFTTAPSANSVIRVNYSDFDVELFNNRKIVGTTSGASALIERAVPRIITDQLNFGLPFELFINSKNLIGSFLNGEEITTDIIDSSGNLINLSADTFSILTKINVIDGGANYNVGDPVIIVGGDADVGATAEVSSVSDGFTSRIVVNYGGAGFKVAGIINSSNTPGNTIITGAIDAVDTSGVNSANVFIVTDDSISSYANVTIDALDYGFPSGYTENLSTRIADALSPLVITGIGPITNAIILFSNTSVNTAILDSEGAIYQSGNSFFDIKSFGSIGRIQIYDGGTNYSIGDEVVFGANPPFTYGVDAAAAVQTVNTSTGAITSISVQPPRIGGTANVQNNTITLYGTGTSFDTELQVGDKIIIRSQERFINSIVSSTEATVNVNFRFTDGTSWANNYPVGSYSKGLIGGVNYEQNNFPTLTVSSISGTGANIAVTSIMGDGERLGAFADAVAGEITSITLTSGGVGYQYIPQVDLSQSGDGTAIANAVVGSSYVSFPGRWITSDSIISSSERRLQGEPFYSDFAYITSSLTEFSKYKDVLKELLHPAGFVNYANLNKEQNVNAPVTSITITTSNTVSGKVSVTNGSIFITGTNTRFNISNTNGILTIGSNVAVNGEIRTIDSIISNTNISVSSAFTSNSSAQTLIILT